MINVGVNENVVFISGRSIRRFVTFNLAYDGRAYHSPNGTRGGIGK